LPIPGKEVLDRQEVGVSYEKPKLIYLPDVIISYLIGATIGENRLY
jgi:hypothetical protein